MTTEAPDGIQEHEVIGVDEFAEYGPIIGCAVIPACAVALLLSWLLKSIGAGAWTQLALGALYATLPCGAFLWWTWNKKAIRLRDGRVLQTSAARRLALTIWLMSLAVLIGRYYTW